MPSEKLTILVHPNTQYCHFVTVLVLSKSQYYALWGTLETVKPFVSDSYYFPPKSLQNWHITCITFTNNTTGACCPVKIGRNDHDEYPNSK